MTIYKLLEREILFKRLRFWIILVLIVEFVLSLTLPNVSTQLISQFSIILTLGILSTLYIRSLDVEDINSRRSVFVIAILFVATIGVFAWFQGNLKIVNNQIVQDITANNGIITVVGVVLIGWIFFSLPYSQQIHLTHTNVVRMQGDVFDKSMRDIKVTATDLLDTAEDPNLSELIKQVIRLVDQLESNESVTRGKDLFDNSIFTVLFSEKVAPITYIVIGLIIEYWTGLFGG